MIREAIGLVVAGERLTRTQAYETMCAIVDGQATSAQIAALATALRMRGETADEIAGFVDAMRARANLISTREPALDTCGTGGDGLGTINVSTAAAIVAAGAGVRVAKHGNRAMTSRSGSADVLEALGVRVDLPPESVRGCIDDVGIGFMFAPIFHPALRHAAATRREIGVRTVFNLLGPLANPALAAYQVVGVPSAGSVSLLGEALSTLGVRRALVVHGRDGGDELSVSGPTLVADVVPGSVRRYEVNPEDAGLAMYPAGAIAGGSPAENAGRVQAVLHGADNADRAAIVLNTAAGLVAADRAQDLREGAELAARAIDSGAAAGKLDEWASYSRRVDDGGAVR